MMSSAKRQSTRVATGSWIVRVRRTVDTDFVCEHCTEQEARDDPYGYATNATDADQIDWTVISVKPNK